MALHPQVQRCYDLAIKGAWHHPFFMIPLGHCEWHEATPKITKTMAISSVIKNGQPECNLYINTEWVAGLPDEEVFGVLAHEILHSMLRHHERSGGKTAENWAKAADMAINASLLDSGIKLPKSGLIPPREYWESAAEEIYGLLESGEIPQPKNYDPDKVGQGCMPQKGENGGQEPGAPNQGQGDDEGDGDGNGQPGEGQPGDGQSDGQSQGDGGNADRAWGEMIAQAQSYSKGTGTAKVMAKLFKPKPVKTQWERLLRKVANRACAKGGRDTQTYQRVNRRSTGDIIMPGWLSTSPSITVIIDTSGSVSDEMLRASLSSVKNIAKTTDVRIFLALHDGVCYYADWVRPEITVEQLSKLCTARGGTDPRAAFEAVRNARARFDAGVYLTDGEVGTYPDKPLNVKRMIVGVVGEGRYRAAIPAAWQEVLVEISDAKA